MKKYNAHIHMALNNLRAERYRDAISGFQAQKHLVNTDAELVQAAFSAAKGAEEWDLAENYLQGLVALLPNRFEVHSTAGTFFQEQRRYAQP